MSEWIRLLALSSIALASLGEVANTFGSVDQTDSCVLALVGFALGEVANVFSWVDQM